MKGKTAFWIAALLLIAALAFESDRAQRRIGASKVLKTVEQVTVMAGRQGRPDPRLLRANVRILQQAIERDPVEVRLLTALGAQYRLLGRPREAVEVYQRALALEPRPEIYLNLSQVQAELGEREEARANLARARQLAPLLVEP